MIYRPHPRSGVVDAEYGAANRRIIAAIARANAADAAAQHVYDDGADLGWQLSAADLAVVDISAMVYDRLAADRPLLVTRPVDEAAVIDANGYLSACEWLDAEASGSIVSAADRLLNDPAAVTRLDQWVRHYFGDTTPGAATERFHAAVGRLMAEWDVWHSRTPVADELEPGQDRED